MKNPCTNRKDVIFDLLDKSYRSDANMRVEQEWISQKKTERQRKDESTEIVGRVPFPMTHPKFHGKQKKSLWII